jgi:hypothetical protein
MRNWNRKRNWLLRRLVLGLAVAAIVAPTAQAGLDEGGRAQSDGGNGALIQGDDKVLAPETGVVLVKGDDKVIPTDGWFANQFAYRHAMPQDYATFATQLRDRQPLVTHGRPTGRQVPIAATGGEGGFGVEDGLLVAASALGAALLAFGAARSTGRTTRPATT